MKKILIIITALTLVLVISGCDDIELKKTEEYYCENDYNGEWNNTFQQCIFETYSQIVYTGCNMVSLLWEFGEAIDDGYTLDLVNGNLVEYKNGIATGDIFTNQDLLDDYCTTGE